MTRVQFLNELYRRLGGMSKEQAEQHLTYYAEMLADRMEEGMTEEEAVASMEDVDTIAGRILQEEKPAQDGDPLQPPSYPEPPRRPVDPERRAAENGGEAGVPQEPEKRRRPRWLIPAAVVVLCLALAGTVAGRSSRRRGITINDSGVYIGNFLSVDDNGIRIGDFLYVGPDGIRVGSGGNVVQTFAEETDTVVDGSWEAVTPDDANLVDSEYTISAQGISAISVDWTSGEVFITVGDAEEICFYESSTEALDESTRLSYRVKDGRLSIKFSERTLNDFHGTKKLAVLLPWSLAGSLEELAVEGTAAYVSIIDVDAGQLSLDTTSGEGYVQGCYGSAEIATTSGDITVEGSVRELEFDSTSGDLLFLEEGQLNRLEAETVSGDVTLFLPEETGLTATFDTVSGTLDGDFDLERDGSRYTCGDGACSIRVDTVSGNVWLYSDQ